MPRRLTLACALVLAACDSAHDGEFPGRPLAVVSGRVSVPSVIDAPLDGSQGELRLALLWSSPTIGVAPAIDALASGAVESESTVPTGFSVAIHTPPADDRLRVAASGRFAIGQLVVYLDADHDGSFDDTTERLVGASRWLVAWSPEGAVGDPLATALQAGVSLVRGSGPCDDAAVRFVAVPDGEVATVLLDPGFDAARAFADPGCRAAADRYDAATWLCPLMGTTRWLCRSGGEATSTVCALCEAYLFPAGADAATCDAWAARCLDIPVTTFEEQTSLECAAEHRLCLAGEGAPPDACDLACACDKRYAVCLDANDEPDAATTCAAKVVGCDWTAAP